MTGENGSTRRKTCPSATLTTTINEIHAYLTDELFMTFHILFASGISLLYITRLNRKDCVLRPQTFAIPDTFPTADLMDNSQT
jgi:hypothetical protein